VWPIISVVALDSFDTRYSLVAHRALGTSNTSRTPWALEALRACIALRARIAPRANLAGLHIDKHSPALLCGLFDLLEHDELLAKPFLHLVGNVLYAARVHGQVLLVTNLVQLLLAALVGSSMRRALLDCNRAVPV
jgi:hypothetical protein